MGAAGRHVGGRGGVPAGRHIRSARTVPTPRPAPSRPGAATPVTVDAAAGDHTAGTAAGPVPPTTPAGAANGLPAGRRRDTGAAAVEFALLTTLLAMTTLGVGALVAGSLEEALQLITKALSGLTGPTG
jgi:Flp pilus assembly pilin Flp